MKIEQRMMWHSSQVTWPTSLNRISPLPLSPATMYIVNTSCLITRTVLHSLIIVTYMNVCPSFVSK